MNPKKLMHARDWNEEDDLTCWIATEKLDGVRAYWDGDHLWTRDGNRIDAPSRITDRLPAGVHLDGEIWAGRGNFETAKAAVQFGRWDSSVQYVVFDVPNQCVGYEERYALIRSAIGPDTRSVLRISAECILSNAHLCRIRNSLQSLGAEGIVAYHPKAHYVPGRTGFVRKVK